MQSIIEEISLYPHLLKEVLHLHKSNSKTLGFLPLKAFKDASREDRILVALDDNKHLLGYLLYAINKRSNFIYITHLCVDSNRRNNGIAKKLVVTLAEKHKAKYKGIRVTCREDYAATKIWEKLGFTFSHDKPGRSKKGSTLFIWWLNFHHSDLFSGIEDNRKLKVVLDSNIIYDLMKDNNSKTQDSFSLLSDWLTEDVEYYITNQLKNDISHNKNKDIRYETINFASSFKLLESKFENLFDKESEIKGIYNKALSPREESDIRHLARTVNSEANYFITKDSGILKHSASFYDKYGLMVLSPETFVIKFSHLINEIDYQPYRLAGTVIEKKILRAEEMSLVYDVFYYGEYEKKREFESKVNSKLITKSVTTFLIGSKMDPLLFYSTYEEENKLEIEFIRFKRTLKNKTILYQIVHDLIYKAVENNKKILCVSEMFIDRELAFVLEEFNFFKVNNIYYRYVSRDLILLQDLVEYLKCNISNHELLALYLSRLSLFNKDKNYCFEIEKLFFPLKITNSGMQCFIIPIQAQWAANLFNINLAAQDLFGGDELLLFNKENAYYRSKNPKTLKNNSRILWYISKGNNKYNESMSISASSYLNELEIDYPKVLFKKYKRLGVYKWKHVLETADNDIMNKIMAFNFELTENFKRPLLREDLELVYENNLHKKYYHPMAPVSIPEKMYFEIYKLGLGLQNE